MQFYIIQISSSNIFAQIALNFFFIQPFLQKHLQTITFNLEFLKYVKIWMMASSYQTLRCNLLSFLADFTDSIFFMFFKAKTNFCFYTINFMYVKSNTYLIDLCIR